MIEDRVFTSIPLASAVIVNVCRRSWNRIFLHSERLRIFLTVLYTDCGFLGISSITGDGNIHREFTVFLYSANTFNTTFGSIIVRIELLVFGSDICILPLT